MTHAYNIAGMTCGSCVAKAKGKLLMLADVTEADVRLTAPPATISMRKHIPVTILQNALNKAGNYSFTEAGGGMDHSADTAETDLLPNTYRPILIIGAYITGATILIEAGKGSLSWHSWMPNFMAGFFLVFSFFKLLNLKGFAESYSSYDIIAKKWLGWGCLHAFIELGLGISYLLNFNPLITNLVTWS